MEKIFSHLWCSSLWYLDSNCGNLMLRFIYLINLYDTVCFSVLTVELCLTYQKLNAEVIHSLQNAAALTTFFCTGGGKKTPAVSSDCF